MSAWFAAAGLGLGLGVVTGMPIGVINVAIVDAATRQRARFAIGLGLGGGIADAIHAALAFAGVGKLVTTAPAVMRGLAIGAALLIVGYAVIAWRARRKRAAAQGEPTAPAGARISVDPLATTPPRGDFIRRGMLAGFVLTSPNPAALGAWVAVAAAVWPDAQPAEAALLAAGVGVGSAAWFAQLARWVRRIPPHHRVLTVIPRLAFGFLIVIAVVGVARSLWA